MDDRYSSCPPLEEIINRKYSRHIAVVEVVHFLIGLGFGACPWLVPWVQVAGIAYILIKELLYDPIQLAGYPWWELETGDRTYIWGPGLDQKIELREKGALDAAVHFGGMLVGAIVISLII